MSERTYVLTVRLPLVARDSMEAREKAHTMIKTLKLTELEQKIVRLQEIFPNSPSVGVPL